jgi:DNA-directed RNA polymerase specialized sigma24 family protein
MGKSVGAIKVMQFRALKALREYFRKKGYEIKA